MTSNDIIMSITKCVSSFFMVLTFSISSVIAQNTCLLSDYNDNSYWLKQINGKVGMESNEGVTIVPSDYELVLPSLIAEFSFVVKNGQLGLYDNIKKVEITFTSKYVAQEVYPMGNDEYLLYYLQNTSYGFEMKEAWKLVRDADGNVAISKPGDFDEPIVPQTGFYHNGIAKIGSVHYAHFYSHVAWSTDYGPEFGEHEPKLQLDKGIQKSGVIAIDRMEFVIPNNYAELTLAHDDVENALSTAYIKVISVDGLDELEGDWLLSEEEKEDPEKRYRYGLYNTDYKTIIYPQSAYLYPILNGGFYKDRSDINKPLELFSAIGEVLLKLDSFQNKVSNIVSSPNYIYVGSAGASETDMEMQIDHFSVFNKEGQFEKNTRFRFENILQKDLALVSLTRSAESYDLVYGIYDLATASFKLEPKYHSILLNYYKDGLLNCPTDACSYYLIASDRNTSIYLDQNFIPFEPEWAIKGDIYDFDTQQTDDNWGEFDPPLLFELIPLAKDRTNHGFAATGPPMSYEVMGRFPEPAENGYFGSIAEKYKNLQIIAVYADPSKQARWGLAYEHDRLFILPPVFDKLSFDADMLNLEIELKEEKGKILLERYFYEQ